MEMIYPGTHGWLWCPNFVLFEWKYLITLQWSMPTLYCVFSATYNLTSVKRAADSQLVKLGFVCCVLICQKTECCSFTTKIVSDPKDPWRTSEKVHRSGTWWHSSGSLEWRWLMFHGRKPAHRNIRTVLGIYIMFVFHYMENQGWSWIAFIWIRYWIHSSNYKINL